MERLKKTNFKMVVHQYEGLFTRCGTDFMCYAPYLIAFVIKAGGGLILFWFACKIRSTNFEIRQVQAEIENLKDENSRLKLKVSQEMET